MHRKKLIWNKTVGNPEYMPVLVEPIRANDVCYLQVAAGKSQQDIGASTASKSRF